MRGDLTLIIETWDAVKPCVNPKEKGDACAALVRVFDEHGMVEYDKVGINECDRHLRQAIEEYFEVDFDDDEEDDDWDY